MNIQYNRIIVTLFNRPWAESILIKPGDCQLAIKSIQLLMNLHQIEITLAFHTDDT